MCSEVQAAIHGPSYGLGVGVWECWLMLPPVPLHYVVGAHIALACVLVVFSMQRTNFLDGATR